MSYHDIYSIVYLPPNLLRTLALRPVRRFVVAGSGKLPRLSAIGQHGPDLPGAGTRGFKNKVPAIRRPGRINQITFVREVEILRVGAVGIHQVQLGYAAAVADKCDRLAGFGIPGRRGAGAVGEGKALKIAAS